MAQLSGFFPYFFIALTQTLVRADSSVGSVSAYLGGNFQTSRLFIFGVPVDTGVSLAKDTGSNTPACIEMCGPEVRSYNVVHVRS